MNPYVGLLFAEIWDEVWEYDEDEDSSNGIDIHKMAKNKRGIYSYGVGNFRELYTLTVI